MLAYPVPFLVDRRAAPRYRFVNVSAECLRWVRVELRGPGLASAPFLAALAPGSAFEVDLRGDDLASNSRLVLRWLRPNGEEYLWGVSL